MARILVIEDNPANLELLAYLLKAYGHRVATAADGEKGRHLAPRYSPDLILCDVHLPRLNGFQLAAELKQNPRLRRTPLIAVTVLATAADRERLLMAGFDGHIPKPIEPERFISSVESFLSAALPAPAMNKTAPKLNSRKRVILVLDTSRSNLSVVTNTLKPLGHEVIATSDAADALELARDKRPQLILSGIRQAGSSGFVLLQSIRNDPQLRHIPVILVSAAARRQEMKDNGLALGAAKFLVAPMNARDFLHEIKHVLTATKNSVTEES